MRWKKHNSQKLAWVNINPYKINWQKSSRSKEQTALKEFLHQFWALKLVLEEFTLPGTLLKVDFLCVNSMIAIEHQGKGAHNEYNPFFHKGSRLNYLSSIKRDIKKAEILEQNGYKLVETQTEDLPLLSREFFREKFGVEL